jgi:hypothetical protein
VIKKIFGIRTKLDKECDKEEAAIKASREWLENEGDMNPVYEPEQIPEEEFIKPEKEND